MPLPSTSNVSRPQALGYGALLDDLYLRLVGNPELQSNPQVETLRPEATRIDTGQNPEDFISEVGQTFSRAQFAGGEGLGFAHREGSAKDRYWDSRRVDVALPDPGDRHAMRLSHQVAAISEEADFGSNTSETLAPIPNHDNDEVHVLRRNTSGGDELWHTADPLAADPTWSADDALDSGGNLYDHVFIGSDHYLAAGSEGIYQASDLAVPWSSLETRTLWAAKGGVLARGSDANSATELYEARIGSDSVLVATLPPGHQWRDVADAGSHILAAADDGYVYAFTADDGADLTLEAQTPFPFEEPQHVASVGGAVMVATEKTFSSGDNSTRLWRATLAGDGTLQELDLIREWSGGSDEWYEPRSMTRDGRNVYLGIKHTFQDDDDVQQEETATWRYSLRTGGLSHLLDDLSDSLFSLGDRLFGDSVDREEVTFEVDGWLMTPAADFFTALDKSWQEITVDANLPFGDDDGTETTIEVYYATDLDAMDDADSTLWTLAGSQSSLETQDTFQITGVESRFLVLMVKLYSSTDQTVTPEVNSVSVTATVIAEEVSIQLPVNVSDVIELPGRKRHNLYGLGERVYQQLRAKHGKEATLELLRPAEKIRGVVWSVSAPVPSVSSRGERTVVCNVEVRGKPTS